MHYDAGIVLHPRRQLVSGGPWFHGGRIRSVDWDPRGRYLLSTGSTAAKLWRAESGELVRTVRAPEGRFVFSGDGSRVIGFADGALRWWSVEDGSLTRFDEQAGPIFAIDSERKLAVVRRRLAAAVFDLEDGRVVFELGPDEIAAAAFDSPRGRLFVAITGRLESRDLAGKRLARIETVPGQPRCAVWTDDRILVAGDMTAVALDADTLEPIERWQGVAAPTLAAARSHDRIALVAGAAFDYAQVFAFDGTMAVAISHVDGTSIAFSPDGTRLLAGTTGGRLCVHDVLTAKQLGTARPSGGDEIARLRDRQLGATPSGSHVVVMAGDQRDDVFLDGASLDPVAGNLRISRDAHPVRTRDANLHVEWWPYERNRDHEPHGVVVYRSDTDPMSGLLAAHSDQRAGPVACDGERVLSGFRADRLSIWDPRTGAILVNLAPPGGSTALWNQAIVVRSVAFSADGSRTLAGLHGGNVLVWDSRTGVLLADWLGEGAVTALACDARFAAIGRASEEANLELRTLEGAPIAVLDGHAAEVRSLLFHRGALLSSGADRAVYLWDLTSL